MGLPGLSRLLARCGGSGRQPIPCPSWLPVHGPAPPTLLPRSAQADEAAPAQAPVGLSVPKSWVLSSFACRSLRGNLLAVAGNSGSSDPSRPVLSASKVQPPWGRLTPAEGKEASLIVENQRFRTFLFGWSAPILAAAPTEPFPCLR